jgi:hypothetical protein
MLRFIPEESEESNFSQQSSSDAHTPPAAARSVAGGAMATVTVSSAPVSPAGDFKNGRDRSAAHSLDNDETPRGTLTLTGALTSF